tara:strand:+ start:925 stop:1089 length:165 start_codon:yes stop_codon:yes gene_type:complete
MSKKFTITVPKKRRNFVKVEMDRLTRPSTFKSRKRKLLAREADKEIKEYFQGGE